MKKSSPGGSRPGAGRPKGEPTESLNLRVPKKHKLKIVAIVKQELLKIKN